MTEREFSGRLGMTSQTFSKAIKSGTCSQRDVIEWAAGQGFAWIEIRDFDLSMARDEVRALAGVARGCGILMQYSWDGTDLVIDPRESMEKGMDNASECGPGSMARVAIAPKYLQDRASPGYPEEVFEELLPRIGRLVSGAKDRGLTMVFENSFEPLRGCPGRYRGMQDFIDAVPGFRMTFDPANALNAAQSRVTQTWSEALEFYNRNVEAVPYMHLKSTLGSVLQERIISGGDIAFGAFISRFPVSAMVCIELPACNDSSTAQARILEAREVLLSQIDPGR